MYTIFNKTLYFRESCYSTISSLEKICDKDYSALLLVLSFLVPEEFVQFKTTWIETNINQIKYEDLIIIREEINQWPKRDKIRRLMSIIGKLNYQIFDEEYKYQSSDDESQSSDSEESNQKFQSYFKLLKLPAEGQSKKSKLNMSSSVFYFPLLYNLFKSQLNKINFDDKTIEYVKQLDLAEDKEKNKQKKTSIYSGLEYKPEKVSYNIVLNQKDIDILNESTFSKESIDNCKNVLQFIANNQKSPELMLESLCKFESS